MPRALLIVGLVWWLGAVACSVGASVPARNPTPPAIADRIDVRKLALDLEGHLGRAVELVGLALNVSSHDEPITLGDYTFPDYTWVNFKADGPVGTMTTVNVVLYVGPKVRDILPGDRYRVWGIVTGRSKVKRTLSGQTDSVPDLVVYRYEPASR